MSRHRGSDNLVSAHDLMTLAEAVEAFKLEEHSISNSYDWYRKDAQGRNRVRLGQIDIPAYKVRNRWMVAKEDMQRALVAHRKHLSLLHDVTVDYQNKILHPELGPTAAMEWGGYSIDGQFHFVWSTYEVYQKRSGGVWKCNTCFALTQCEHNRTECHRCRDWSDCGNDCTLSRVFCTQCGTSMDK
jgi:hypothetical protein